MSIGALEETALSAKEKATQQLMQNLFESWKRNAPDIRLKKKPIRSPAIPSIEANKLENGTYHDDSNNLLSHRLLLLYPIY